MKKTLLFSLLVFFMAQANLTRAIQAYPHPIDFTQPDGSVFKLKLMGDEFFHWAETKDGYTIMFNDEGFYEYAIISNDGKLTPSGIKVNAVDKREVAEEIFLKGIKKHLMYSSEQISLFKQIKQIHAEETKNQKAFPTTGNRKLVCILIGYTDLAFTKTQSDFNNLFNQVGYSFDGATGSVKDYYLENSWDQFNLTVDIAGPYTASNTMAYYGANSGGYDVRPRELVTEAVNLADAAVDFSDYDNDNDGSVDGVYIIYAGYGEEAGASSDAIWAHAWSISPVVKDGVTISKYSCSAELRSNSGTGITRIGVVCHEFGHVLGAPDFYDTDYATGGSYSGTGSWDMMAGGSWNNGGATPAHHNGFTKWYYYGWLTPIELSSPQTITLSNIESNQQLYYYTTPSTNEYWLLENRQQTGFDGSLPGHGMIIYHVDQDNVDAHDGSNDINATHPQYMYPVCASAGGNPPTYGTINSGGCPFPGTSNKTSFTDATSPSSTDWAGNNTNKPITNISESAGTITFDFMGGAQGNPENFTATAVSISQIDLSWDLNSNNDNVLIAWSADGTFGTPIDGTNYSANDAITGGGTVLQYSNGTSYNHTSLSASTTYYYKAWSYDGANYTPGITANATTLCETITTFPFTEDFSGGALPNCWENIDNQGGGQVWSFNNPGARSILTTSNANGFAILDSDNYGSGNSQNADLVTPTLDFSSTSSVTLEFEHYFRSFSGSSATLSYSINGGSTWTAIQSWTSSTTNATAFSQDMTTELAGQANCKIKWNYTGAYGYYWAVDDISIDVVYGVPIADAGQDQAICAGATGTMNGSFSGTATSATWSHNGDGNFDNASNLDAVYTPGSNDISTGNVTLTLTTNDPDGAGPQVPATDDMVLTINQLPVAPTSVNATNTTICSGESTQLSYTGGSGTSFVWYTSSCGSSQVGTGNNLTVNPTATTTYYGRWENNCGESTCETVTISIGPLPTAPTSVSATNTTICNGESSQLSYTGGTGTSFVWYTSSCGGSQVGTGNNLTVYPTATTTYYGRWENTCGESTCETVTVTVNQLPTAPTSVNATNTTICNGESTQLSYTGGSGTSFVWYTGSCGGSQVGTGNNLTVYPTAETTYYGRWENACGESTCETVTITISPLPTAPTSVSATNTTICSGGSTQLSYTGGTGTDFVWYTGSCGGSQVGTGNNLAVYPTATTTYYGRWENACGESTCESVEIIVNDLPSAAATNDGPACEGGDIQLNAAPNGMVSYAWTGPNGFTSNEQNPLITNIDISNAGTYTLTIEDANGCENSDDTELAVNANPSAAASNNGPLYEGDELQLNSTPDGMASYSWTGPNGFVSTTQNPTVANVTMGDAGEYEVEVQDANGCKGTAITDVTINATPLYSVTFIVTDQNDNYIEGATINLDGYGERTTNSVGEAIFEDVSSSTYTYTVTINGVAPIMGDVIVVDQDVTVEVIAPIGIETLSGNSFSIYPNPAEEHFFIEFTKNLGEVQLEIIDINGKVIDKYTFEIDNTRIKQKIDLGHLINGIYQLKIKSRNAIKIEKLIVQ